MPRVALHINKMNMKIGTSSGSMEAKNINEGVEPKVAEITVKETTKWSFWVLSFLCGSLAILCFYFFFEEGNFSDFTGLCSGLFFGVISFLLVSPWKRLNLSIMGISVIVWGNLISETFFQIILYMAGSLMLIGAHKEIFLKAGKIVLKPVIVIGKIIGKIISSVFKFFSWAFFFVVALGPLWIIVILLLLILLVLL